MPRKRAVGVVTTSPVELTAAIPTRADRRAAIPIRVGTTGAGTPPDGAALPPGARATSEVAVAMGLAGPREVVGPVVNAPMARGDTARVLGRVLRIVV